MDVRTTPGRFEIRNFRGEKVNAYRPTKNGNASFNVGNSARMPLLIAIKEPDVKKKKKEEIFLVLNRNEERGRKRGKEDERKSVRKKEIERERERERERENERVNDACA
ncbi:hypothetical protein P5V15_011255 [Pogonomyrmex californicus]